MAIKLFQIKAEVRLSRSSAKYIEQRLAGYFCTYIVAAHALDDAKAEIEKEVAGESAEIRFDVVSENPWESSTEPFESRVAARIIRRSGRAFYRDVPDGSSIRKLEEKGE